MIPFQKIDHECSKNVTKDCSEATDVFSKEAESNLGRAICNEFPGNSYSRNKRVIWPEGLCWEDGTGTKAIISEAQSTSKSWLWVFTLGDLSPTDDSYDWLLLSKFRETTNPHQVLDNIKNRKFPSKRNHHSAYSASRRDDKPVASGCNREARLVQPSHKTVSSIGASQVSAIGDPLIVGKSGRPSIPHGHCSLFAAWTNSGEWEALPGKWEIEERFDVYRTGRIETKGEWIEGANRTIGYADEGNQWNGAENRLDNCRAEGKRGKTERTKGSHRSTHRRSLCFA